MFFLTFALFFPQMLCIALKFWGVAWATSILVVGAYDNLHEHVLRLHYSRLPQRIFHYWPDGRRDIRRPRKRWKDQISPWSGTSLKLVERLLNNWNIFTPLASRYRTMHKSGRISVKIDPDPCSNLHEFCSTLYHIHQDEGAFHTFHKTILFHFVFQANLWIPFLRNILLRSRCHHQYISFPFEISSPPFMGLFVDFWSN